MNFSISNESTYSPRSKCLIFLVVIFSKGSKKGGMRTIFQVNGQMTDRASALFGDEALVN